MRRGRSDAGAHPAGRQEHLADQVVVLVGGQRGRQQGLVQGQGRPAVALQDQGLHVGVVQPPLRMAQGREVAQLLLQVCAMGLEWMSQECGVWRWYRSPCRQRLPAGSGTRGSAAPPAEVCNVFQSGESAVWHQTVVPCRRPRRQGLRIDTHI